MKKICEADNGMERCSQLVAHTCHKFTLELVQSFRLPMPRGDLSQIVFLQTSNLLFGRLSLRDISDHRHDQNSAVGVNWAQSDLHWKFGTVFTHGIQI